MKKLRLEFIKDALTKEQMKTFVGGSGSGVPADPGTGGTSEKALRKCCWKNTTRCSECVMATAQAICDEGAELKTC